MSELKPNTVRLSTARRVAQRIEANASAKAAVSRRRVRTFMQIRGAPSREAARSRACVAMRDKAVPHTTNSS
jgi:hypothetical protein